MARTSRLVICLCGVTGMELTTLRRTSSTWREASRQRAKTTAGRKERTSTGPSSPSALSSASSPNGRASSPSPPVRTLTLSRSSGPQHIPYRDSKLTRLLQPALSGNSRVAIICTISPDVEQATESLSTLKFAKRAKMVVTKAERGVVRSFLLGRRWYES